MHPPEIVNLGLRVRVVSFAVCVLAVLLPFFIFAGILPFSSRYYCLFGVCLVCVVGAIICRITRTELGLSSQKWSGLVSIVAITITFVLALLASKHFAIRSYPPTTDSGFLAFYVVASAPAQEFIYRSFAFAMLERMKASKWLSVVITTSLYTFMHLIYRDSLTLCATLLFGIAWGTHFARYRDSKQIVISHALVGVAAFLVGAA